MFEYRPIIQTIQLNKLHFNLDVLRLDLIDPLVSGNKWFKLKHNLTKAVHNNYKTILTFGGPHSNHIAAMASACQSLKLNSIAIVRGHASDAFSPTLKQAQNNGMVLHFISRQDYHNKTEPSFLQELKKQFGEFYLVPEGGNNDEGIKGCMEILNPNWNYDYVFCACGTGATFAGLLASANPQQKVIGINVLKGENSMPQEIQKNLKKIFPDKNYFIQGNESLENNFLKGNAIINTFAFSGYAKFNQNLVDFKTRFEKENAIPLDYVYTNKLFYAIEEMMISEKIKSKAKVLAIHSGGLQGNVAFEQRFFKS